MEEPCILVIERSQSEKGKKLYDFIYDIPEKAKLWR